MVDEALGVQMPDQVVGELVRMLDTPLPLQSVAVSESEQGSAASPSRVASALPTKDIASSLESQVGENPETQRRESASQGSSFVQQITSYKSRNRSTGQSLHKSRSATMGNTSSSSARSGTTPVVGTSSRGGASLTRHNATVETNDYGLRAADASDSRDHAYGNAQSAGLLYLEDNSARYQIEDYKGWLPAHAKTKLAFWTSEYPAELEVTMKHVSHLATQRVM